MNRRTVLIVIGLVTLLAAVALMNDEEPFESSPTAPVMPAIESETDCALLQTMFDNAEIAGDNQREQGDLDDARAYTRAMERADTRMREIGCYD